MVTRVIPEQRVLHCMGCQHHKVERDLLVDYCAATSRLFAPAEIHAIHQAMPGTDQAFAAWCPLREIQEADA